ncbi:MAG: transporter, partial [Oxalobacteraceae bacterium]|nr:transporter [Oxalobacteraceae bacterium]
FFHYMYFDIAKFSYLQFGVLVPYIALGPTVVSGAITLGAMQQIVRAFGRVEMSFQFLVRSWSTIVELISVYKRLRAFEAQIVLFRGNAGVTDNAS